MEGVSDVRIALFQRVLCGGQLLEAALDIDMLGCVANVPRGYVPFQARPWPMFSGGTIADLCPKFLDSTIKSCCVDRDVPFNQQVPHNSMPNGTLAISRDGQKDHILLRTVTVKGIVAYHQHLLYDFLKTALWAPVSATEPANRL